MAARRHGRARSVPQESVGVAIGTAAEPTTRSRMKELTRRQQEILTFIRTFTDREGVPPTVREIGARFKVTPRAAFDHLAALERKGVLERRATTGRASRSLVLTDRSRASEVAEIPILGRVAAGVPLLAEENREGALT